MHAARRRSTRNGFPEADRRRLVAALERDDFDPDQPLLPRDSITWTVNREAALLLGGGRALLMQVAHPLVAEGVAQFSNFREDPLSRLWRTLELTLTMTFASARKAILAVREIERAHARVRGELTETVGPYPAGTEFSAIDPELMFWVHATLVDSALVVYDKFVAKLSREEKVSYYDESKVSARLMGIEEKFLPPTFADFERYMRAMLRSDILSVGSSGQAVANGVLYPVRPLGLSQAMFPARLITFELLPDVLRERYGLSSLPLVGGAIETFGMVSRSLLPWLPPQFRSMPLGPSTIATLRAWTG